MFFVRLFAGLAAIAALGMIFIARAANSQRRAKDQEATYLALSSRDKREDAVARARGQALLLLENENSCSAWFREVDDDPAGVLRSLHFKIDKKKQEYVLRMADGHGEEHYKHPWSARSWQWGGRNSTVDINPNGPFFNRVSPVVELGPVGNLVRYSGFRMLTIGPFKGDTAEAQITTMLHELAHVTARIPEDTDTWDGKSAKNTEEVLRHCKNQIQEFARLN